MNEITLNLNNKSDIPLYEQIYSHIRDEIKAGNMPCTSKLPSTRKLADYLQVSRSTIDMAYDQLLSEGYIESRPKSGYYVSEISLLYNISTPSIKTDKINTVKTSKKYIDFSPRGIDLTNFPYELWRKLTKKVLIDYNKDLFGAGDVKGDIRLRTTICNYLYEARGVQCRPEQIIIGAGTDYLFLLLDRIIDSSYGLAMENPTYKQAYRMFSSFGRRVIPMKMDNNGMRIDNLRDSGASVAYVMPSHQFPLGNVMPIKRRQELLEWANSGNKYIIEDDYDSEFRYKGKPIPALQGMDANGKVIYIGTFSKSIAPAIRMSYMVLPQQLLPEYDKKVSFYSSTVSRIDQVVVEEFISEGHYERHLNRMRAIYRTKQEILLNEIKKFTFPYTIKGENSGIHVLLKPDESITECELVNSALKAGVKVYGIEEYYIDEMYEKEKGIMLGYANLTEKQIINGVSKLCEAWNQKTQS